MVRTALLAAWCLAAAVCTADEPLHPIDAILAETAREHGLAAAPLCSDELFLRRATLDLIGRIPTLAEQQAFRAAPDREALIDRLLDSDEFPRHWAEVWTVQWFGYGANELADRDALQQWLEAALRSHRPYDEIVQSLIAATGESVFSGPVNFLLRYPDEPVVKVSRAFLGIRLDCARCHDHPFDRWKRDDFERMNRFFDTMERRALAQGNTQLVDVVRTVEPQDRPRFLSGAEPRTSQWRAEFALFLVKSRPFARNFGNRLWYHLMGRGVVHPVDDVNRSNPPSVPALWEWLADEALRTRFDVRSLLRALCRSQAYQRSSLARRGDEERQRLFLVRSIKPLTPEVWHASMSVALRRQSTPAARAAFVQAFYGNALDGDFGSSWEYRETLQGLMNRLIDRVDPPATGIDELFQTFLCRGPTDTERAACADCSPRELTYLLLHAQEFAFNH
uniref:DUF1549 domain-containing protein n=1 Tax=Schlesneria paludicola TaxID=360056 RepID=A0A7C4QRB7_9PLAN